MDDPTFDNIAERLRKVNELIETLDPAIRADAFLILRPYVAGNADQDSDDETQSQQAARKKRQPKKRGTSPPSRQTAAKPKRTAVVVDASAEEFVRSQDISEPHLTVRAIAAWWFSQYGSTAITNADLRAIADQIGVTLPQRPDMSLKRSANANGKPIFRSGGKGKLVPTAPHGELYFQEEYGVKKGTKAPPSANE
jgi:hypothetical protein